MSYYSTQTDLENRAKASLIVFWADDNGDGVADTLVINHALKWAYDEINAALTDLYASYLPFTGVTLPGVIFNISTTFAVYILATRAEDFLTTGQRYAKEYDEARKRLQRIADGKDDLLLGDDTVAGKDAGSSSTRFTPSEEPIYSRTTLDSYCNFSGQ